MAKAIVTIEIAPGLTKKALKTILHAELKAAFDEGAREIEVRFT